MTFDCETLDAVMAKRKFDRIKIKCDRREWPTVTERQHPKNL